MSEPEIVTDGERLVRLSKLLAYVADPGNSMHSWRCSDPSRDPTPCVCASRVAALLDAIEAARTPADGPVEWFGYTRDVHCDDLLAIVERHWMWHGKCLTCRGSDRRRSVEWPCPDVVLVIDRLRYWGYLGVPNECDDT